MPDKSSCYFLSRHIIPGEFVPWLFHYILSFHGFREICWRLVRESWSPGPNQAPDLYSHLNCVVWSWSIPTVCHTFAAPFGNKPPDENHNTDWENRTTCQVLHWWWVFIFIIIIIIINSHNNISWKQHWYSAILYENVKYFAYAITLGHTIPLLRSLCNLWAAPKLWLRTTRSDLVNNFFRHLTDRICFKIPDKSLTIVEAEERMQIFQFLEVVLLEILEIITEIKSKEIP